MSRGFVKEEDQEEAPIIPPRAALPKGETNYVTQRGMELLLKEKEEFERQHPSGDAINDTEKRRQNMEIDGKLKLLNERIASARIINIDEQPTDEVRFGATVTYKLNGNSFTLTIVGVDEANIKEKRVSFVAPLVKSMYGKRVGDKVKFELDGRSMLIEITAISYHTS